jgi:hypothetical protein
MHGSFPLCLALAGCWQANALHLAKHQAHSSNNTARAARARRFYVWTAWQGMSHGVSPAKMMTFKANKSPPQGLFVILNDILLWKISFNKHNFHLG